MQYGGHGETKGSVDLKDLYPVGIDASKASPEAVKRFELWKNSLSFAMLSEDEARETFPLAFLNPGEQHTGKCAGSSDIITRGKERFEREYPLLNGDTVVKSVAEVVHVNGGNVEFGNESVESMYFFR